MGSEMGLRNSVQGKGSNLAKTGKGLLEDLLNQTPCLGSWGPGCVELRHQRAPLAAEYVLAAEREKAAIHLMEYI